MHVIVAAGWMKIVITKTKRPTHDKLGVVRKVIIKRNPLRTLKVFPTSPLNFLMPWCCLSWMPLSKGPKTCQVGGWQWNTKHITIDISISKPIIYITINTISSYTDILCRVTSSIAIINKRMPHEYLYNNISQISRKQAVPHHRDSIQCILPCISWIIMNHHESTKVLGCGTCEIHEIHQCLPFSIQQWNMQHWPVSHQVHLAATSLRQLLPTNFAHQAL